jgi:large subunit ribosomal protein L25
MGNLYIRAIETKEDMTKVINDAFTPGLISYLGFNRKVKFEMKKMKRISKKYKIDDIIDVKLKERFMCCKIGNMIIDEMTGCVSWVELERVSSSSFKNKKIPLVFENANILKSAKKEIKVLLTEVDVVGKTSELPEYILIDLNDITFKNEITVANLDIGNNLKIINKKDDVIVTTKSKKSFYYCFS